MPSTFSPLKIQLMATGENNTTWGDVTNLNLGTALEEAIVGSADVTFASADVTLTLTDTNASQTARNMRLRCTGTTGGSTRNLVVPSIEKPYIVKNDCADSVVVKTAAGTGITVPAGKTMWVYSDATNVVDAVTHLSSLTLGTDLAVSDGGTGASTFTANGVIYGNTTSALLATAAGTTGQVLVGNTGGAPSWATLSGIGVTSFSGGTTGLTPNTATTGVVTLAGTLGVANGGTGTATAFTAGSVVFAGASGVYSQDNANFFWDNTNDRLGIGTTSPSAKVTIAGTAATTSQVLNSTGSTTGATYGRWFNTGSDLIWGIESSAGGALLTGASAYAAVLYTNSAVPLQFGTGGIVKATLTSAGDVGIGTNNPISTLDVTGSAGITTTSGGNTARIIAAASGTFFGSTTNTAVIFQANSTERMRITSAGNVGVGTTAPDTRMTVSSTSQYAINTLNPTAVAANKSGIAFYGLNSSTATQFYAGIAADFVATAGGSQTGALVFETINNNSVGERMRITGPGNVGIGTSSPADKLTVNGFITTTAGAYSSTNGGNAVKLGAAGQMNFGAGGSDLILATNAGNIRFGDWNTNTERMRIDTSGNLLVGGTTAFNSTAGRGNIGIDGASSILNFGNSGASSAYIFSTSASLEINAIGSRFLQLTTNSAERMRITSAGNVGIGMTTPAQKLVVNGNIRTDVGSGGTVTVFETDATRANLGTFGADASGAYIDSSYSTGGSGAVLFRTIGTERMRITDTGNVGIGTSSPAARLHVVNSTINAQLRLQDVTTDATNKYGVVGTGHYTNAQSPILAVGVGSLAASNTVYVGGGFGSLNAATAIQFFTAANNTTLTGTERMRIDSSGNVGIGTTTPDVFARGYSGRILGISSTGQSAIELNSATGSGAYFDFGVNGTRTASIYSDASSTDFSALGARILSLGTSGAAALVLNTNNTERARIDSSGNLLVGCTSTAFASGQNTGIYLTNTTGGTGGLHIKNTANNTGTNVVTFYGWDGTQTGSILTYVNVTNYNTSSDARLKHDIIDAPEASSLIDAIQVRSFKWNADDSEQRYGFVAQELVEVAPEAVSQPEDPDEMMGVDYSKLVPMLVKEIQSLRARVAQLEGN